MGGRWWRRADNMLRVEVVAGGFGAGAVRGAADAGLHRATALLNSLHVCFGVTMHPYPC